MFLTREGAPRRCFRTTAVEDCDAHPLEDRDPLVSLGMVVGEAAVSSSCMLCSWSVVAIVNMSPRPRCSPTPSSSNGTVTFNVTPAAVLRWLLPAQGQSREPESR